MTVLDACGHCGGAFSISDADPVTLEPVYSCILCGREPKPAAATAIPAPQAWSSAQGGVPPKLTYCEAASIAALLRQGVHPYEMARAFGRPVPLIYSIRAGKYAARAE